MGKRVRIFWLYEIPHARGRAQTAVSATEHETPLALLFVHIDANIFQGWSPLSAASTALGIVER